MNGTLKNMILMLLLVAFINIHAQKSSKDLTDHPLYPAREYSKIISKKVFYTTQYNLIKKYRELLPGGDVLINDFKVQTIKGRVTRIKYFVPAWRIYVEHDSLLNRFCNDIMLMHEFVLPSKSNLDRYIPNENGLYKVLGEPEDRIPEDNYYFVLARFNNGKKVYIVITGDYNLLHDGNYYTVDVVETNEKQFITTYEIGDYIHNVGVVNISSILFETGSAQVTKESLKEVQFLAEFLKTEPDLKIRIGGHTDNVGDSKFNQRLSEERAKFLKKLLVETYGADGSRITTIGYGESRPIADNRTVEGRTLNRRVEIIKVQ